jgi:hypothetical protein
VTGVSASWDDEELLDALRQALRSREAVPSDFVDAGKHAYAWRNIDAELAELTYDSLSSAEYELELSTRAEAASIRALTFTSAHLTIELEIVGDSLLGQVVPGQPAAITMQPRVGAGITLDADEIGRFWIEPVPAGLFRLHCRTATGIETLTGWFTLERD